MADAGNATCRGAARGGRCQGGRACVHDAAWFSIFNCCSSALKKKDCRSHFISRHSLIPCHLCTATFLPTVQFPGKRRVKHAFHHFFPSCTSTDRLAFMLSFEPALPPPPLPFPSSPRQHLRKGTPMAAGTPLPSFIPSCTPHRHLQLTQQLAQSPQPQP